MVNFEKKNEEPNLKIEQILNDVKRVGPEKPLGYVAISDLTDVCKIDPSKLKKELEQKGLKTILFGQGESIVNGEALYVYDENSLKSLLDNNHTMLVKSGWPTEPESFVRNLNTPVDQGTDLFDLIADAFGDKTNIGRKKKETILSNGNPGFDKWFY